MSKDKVLDELLKTGNAKIDFRGVIAEEPRKNQVTLKSWPPGKRFETILNKLSKHFESGEVGFTDLSVTTTEIVFQVLRERNRDVIYRRFVSDLKEAIEGSISFEIITVNTNKTVIQKSVDQLLIDTYDMYSETTETMLKEEIKRLNETISEYEILLKIRPVIASGISAKLSKEKILNEIKKLTDVSKQVANELINKYRINRLLTVDVDTAELNKEIKQFKDTLKHLTEYVLEDYNGFFKTN